MMPSTTNAMQPQSPISSPHGKLPVTKIAVGPSAPPMVPMLVPEGSPTPSIHRERNSGGSISRPAAPAAMATHFQKRRRRLFCSASWPVSAPSLSASTSCGALGMMLSGAGVPSSSSTGTPRQSASCTSRSASGTESPVSRT